MVTTAKESLVWILVYHNLDKWRGEGSIQRWGGHTEHHKSRKSSWHRDIGRDWRDTWKPSAPKTCGITGAGASSSSSSSSSCVRPHRKTTPAVPSNQDGTPLSITQTLNHSCWEWARSQLLSWIFVWLDGVTVTARRSSAPYLYLCPVNEHSGTLTSGRLTNGFFSTESHQVICPAPVSWHPISVEKKKKIWVPASGQRPSSRLEQSARHCCGAVVKSKSLDYP